MPHSPKIATCCYCGTRAALVLSGRDRHELSCASCGAPLHNLKMLRADHDGRPDLAGKPRKPQKLPKADYDRLRKRKKKKSPARRLLGEAFDLIEDIFD
jgi:hypothetical protein